MTNRAWMILGAIVAVVIVGAAAVFAVTGIGGGDRMHEVVDENTDEHAAIDPVATDPAVAAQSALVRGFTWSPAEQASDLDAFVGAHDVTTAAFHEKTEQAAANQPPQARPRQWESWATSEDVVQAVATPGTATVEADRASVIVTVAQEVQHNDGDTTPFSKFDVAADMALVDGAWLLDNYEIRSVAY